MGLALSRKSEPWLPVVSALSVSIPSLTNRGPLPRISIFSKFQSRLTTKFMTTKFKRPSQKITPTVVQEVRDYAYAIARDERFHGVPARWTFWALSNTISEQAQEEAMVKNLPPWSGVPEWRRSGKELRVHDNCQNLGAGLRSSDSETQFLPDPHWL